ncbi:MAG: hypothetical protein M0R46_07560 [Candidatus Muirbacterium halophilum]|nr:hypothetical protein [Candidatus Muirbacterium halophilum]MCK9475757.1 hypothetical protein [Candidatus Muirbacterium halophilum]
MGKKLSMLKIKPGMRLAKPVYQADLCLLESGKILTSRIIQLLKNRKVIRLEVI